MNLPNVEWGHPVHPTTVGKNQNPVRHHHHSRGGHQPHLHHHSGKAEGCEPCTHQWCPRQVPIEETSFMWFLPNILPTTCFHIVRSISKHWGISKHLGNVPILQRRIQCQQEFVKLPVLKGHLDTPMEDRCIKGIIACC